MKSLSTAEKTSTYKQNLKSSQGHSFTKVSYIEDDLTETICNDVLFPISIKKLGKKPKYANINYTPSAATCKFQVLNQSAKYSPKNTASAFYDIFKRDRIFKFYDGKYDVTGDVETSESLSLSTTDNFYYFTKYSASPVGVILDVSNTGLTTDDYFSDLFTPKYGDEHYGDSTYTPEGYVIFKKENPTEYEYEFTKFDLTCNNTNGEIYYKFGESDTEIKGIGTSDGWINAGYTENGTKTVNFTDVIGSKYIYIAVIFNTADWASTIRISDVKLYYKDHIEWVLLGTFYIDDPDFNDKRSPGISTINVTGRNAWKKALETTINIENINGKYLHEIIKSLADRAGLTYSVTSIATLTAYGARTLTTGYEKDEKIEKFYEDIMQIIGKSYRMYISDDNILYVTARPSTYAADNIFNYKRYIEAEQKFVSDTQLQRFGIVSSQGVMIASASLDSETFNSAGAKTFTWSGDAIAKYIVYTVNSGDAVISAVEFLNESAIVTITGTVIDITIAVWGCKYSSGAPTYAGEAVDWDNMDKNNGFASRVVNPLVISDAECKTITENFITEYGDPAFNIDLKDCFINALLEINDMVMVLSADLFEDSLYQIQGIEYVIQNEVSKKANFILIDTGLKFSDQGTFIYDRDFLISANAAMDYDIGYIYDASYAIGATASEIGTSQYYTDIDCN